ncbi:hypothetical protein PHYSODRAFT_296592 [Phytophthora sojae]|uniref:CCHC-type domain-containing protein n=1 Tax=Phytophthora sojae (strain P6497) TaxID=1094619 RepID=G4YYG6_PHYSP|nr:hypothetical protein PHYSODRAFT_296592 [Phytophthora sojae]EGZ24553.1 hypothetical protein PHYSODRAFT_296592 [Phytophthora sojae]|eukprot:XP_009519841.1 hypothetical protein PHYSODRAFT_296592 [Phytophthora sojae]
MQRRKQARWKIDKALSPDLSKTVEEEATPFGVLERLRKMFVGATKLSLVHQLRAVMEMKYEKGTNLLVFIEELKQDFTKLENMESTELEFDKLVELLESSYLEVKRQDQLQGRGSEAKSHSDSALFSKGKQRAPGRDKRTADDDDGKCRHCHMRGHFIRDCRIYREKQEHGWRHPLPFRTRKDFHDDDRDPTRKRDYQREEDRKREGDRKRSRDDKESDGRHSRGDKSKFRKQ